MEPRVHQENKPAPSRLRTVVLWCIGTVLVASVASTSAVAQTVLPKYARQPVDLSRFSCAHGLDSSFVHSICYRAAERRVVVRLRGVWYHYCNVPNDAVVDWLHAGSLGRHFNDHIKDVGRYQCRGL